MRSSRSCTFRRPEIEALEPRLVLDAAFAFATAIGDSGEGGLSYPVAVPTAVGTDAAGNVYLAGSFQSVIQFGEEPGAGEPSLESTGDVTVDDVFIAKYSPAGTLLWDQALQPSNPFNTPPNLTLGGMAVDSAGDVYLTGTLTGDELVGSGPGQVTLSYENGAAFLVGLNTNGNVSFAETVGGPSAYGSAVAIDGQGHVLVAGEFNTDDANFAPGPGTALLSYSGGLTVDMFVASYNADGSYRWAKDIGGAPTSTGAQGGDVAPSSIASDAAGDVIVAGAFGNTADFDPGPGIADLTPGPNGGIFIVKLDSAGDYVWAKSRDRVLAEDYSLNISVGADSKGDAFLAVGPEIGPSFGAPGFVEGFDSTGNLQWTQTAASGVEEVQLTVDSQNEVFVAGTVGDITGTMGNLSSIFTGYPNVQVDAPRDGEYFAARLDIHGQLQGVRTASYVHGNDEYDATTGRGNVLGIAPAPGGDLAMTGNYNLGASFGSTILPPEDFTAGVLDTTENTGFVTVTTPIPSTPQGVTLVLDPASNNGTAANPIEIDSSTPTFDVTGVAATAVVTILANNDDSTGPPAFQAMGSRVGPGPLTLSAPTLSSPGLESGLHYSFYLLSDDPAAGVSVVSNTVTARSISRSREFFPAPSSRTRAARRCPRGAWSPIRRFPSLARRVIPITLIWSMGPARCWLRNSFLP